MVVLSLGFDTLSGDPLGSFALRTVDFQKIGAMVSQLGLPVLAVQEGGYLVSALGEAARQFFTGLGTAGEQGP